MGCLVMTVPQYVTRPAGLQRRLHSLTAHPTHLHTPSKPRPHPYPHPPPQNHTQTYAEELVRLPGCFLCYTPAADPPAVAPLPAAVNGFVTFGSFNNLAKITPTVLSQWASILHRWGTDSDLSCFSMHISPMSLWLPCWLLSLLSQ